VVRGASGIRRCRKLSHSCMPFQARALISRPYFIDADPAWRRSAGGTVPLKGGAEPLRVFCGARSEPTRDSTRRYAGSSEAITRASGVRSTRASSPLVRDAKKHGRPPRVAGWPTPRGYEQDHCRQLARWMFSRNSKTGSKRRRRTLRQSLHDVGTGAEGSEASPPSRSDVLDTRGHETNLIALAPKGLFAAMRKDRADMATPSSRKMLGSGRLRRAGLGIRERAAPEGPARLRLGAATQRSWRISGTWRSTRLTTKEPSRASRNGGRGLRRRGESARRDRARRDRRPLTMQRPRRFGEQELETRQAAPSRPRGPPIRSPQRNAPSRTATGRDFAPSGRGRHGVGLAVPRRRSLDKNLD